MSANKFCPVQPDKPALSEYYSDYSGNRMYFCCEQCLMAFRTSPESFTSSLNGKQKSHPGTSTHSHSHAFALQPEVIDTQWISLDRKGWSLLSLSLLALVLLVLRRKFRKGPVRELRLSSHYLMTANVILLGLLLGIGWNCYHLWRASFLTQLKEVVHYATFHDYGEPPVPAKPKISRRIKGAFYRGNDERNPGLFNNGNYRTCSFNISLQSDNGKEIDYGDQLANRHVSLRFEIVRAPHTADFFFSDERMRTILLTTKGDPFLGYITPIDDAVELTTIQDKQRWEAIYRLCKVAPKGPEKHTGIVYVAEKRYFRNFFGNVKVGGSRFHYAVQYELSFNDGTISQESDLWMGALYRTRRFPQWRLPLHEWFSHEPIPEIPGKHTDDPKLLGLDEYSE